jgi:hypothetical protein
MAILYNAGLHKSIDALVKREQALVFTEMIGRNLEPDADMYRRYPAGEVYDADFFKSRFFHA